MINSFFPGIGNFTDMGKGQVLGVMSRSSVGEYILAGEPKEELSLIVSKAIVEGAMTLIPHGHEAQKMITITNQVGLQKVLLKCFKLKISLLG